MNSQSPAANQDLELLIGAGADPTALAAFLDGLDDAGRVREVRSLSRKALGALYDRCASAPPLQLADFVPSSLPVGKTLVCAGLNNLPMFRSFEKRLVRTASGQVFGFNFQSMSFVTGPGYFEITQSGSELLFDYTKVPSQSDVPSDWPRVLPNDRGFSHLVYKNLHDFCRRVSRDVVIGHATRNGESLPQYFILARQLG
ncbi:MAG: hypothetical protein JNM40_11310 [Myxococcales bacterium]|nr:hypothetical protein [Myxococcales bacterium]